MPSTFQPFIDDKMQISKVGKSNEESCFAYIQEKDHENFLLLMDYKLNPEYNHLYIAIDKNQKIHGVFQILSGHIQVRGSEEAVETFFCYLKEQEDEVQGITAHSLYQDLINKYFPELKSRTNKYRMVFSEEIQHIKPQFEYQRLKGTKENKKKIASFIQNADPIHWGKVQSKNLIVDEMRPYFVIFGEDKKILSLTGLWFDERIGLINVVATHPEYRKKGYATSIISSSIDWLSQRTSKIIIDVRTDNKLAIRIYQKLGFQIAYEFQIITLEA
jgi:ribosomal protein S18 acetylase RimI-like enzyme